MNASTPRGGRSESSRALLLCFLSAFVVARPCQAHDEPAELLKYRTTPTIHGLYEINQEAQKFLTRQPRKKSGDWKAVGPDIRMQVPRCAVPLRTRWARESDNEENFPGVMVICRKTVDRKDPDWAVLVSSYIQAERKLDMQKKFPGFAYPPIPESR